MRLNAIYTIHSAEDGGTSIINDVDLSSIALDFNNKDLYGNYACGCQHFLKIVT